MEDSAASSGLGETLGVKCTTASRLAVWESPRGQPCMLCPLLHVQPPHHKAVKTPHGKLALSDVPHCESLPLYTFIYLVTNVLPFILIQGRFLTSDVTLSHDSDSSPVKRHLDMSR